MFKDKSLGHTDLNFSASPNKDEVTHFMSVQSQKVFFSAALETVVVKFMTILVNLVMSWHLLLNFTSHDTFLSCTLNHGRFTPDSELNHSYMRHPF